MGKQVRVYHEGLDAIALIAQDSLPHYAERGWVFVEDEHVEGVSTLESEEDGPLEEEPKDESEEDSPDNQEEY